MKKISIRSLAIIKNKMILVAAFLGICNNQKIIKFLI